MREFEKRLENWGRYCRSSGSGRGTTATYRVCEMLAKSRQRYSLEEEYSRSQNYGSIDHTDAEFIEACLVKVRNYNDFNILGNKILHKLFTAHYVQRSDVRYTCRVLRIPFREYDEILDECVNKFKRMVELFESMGYHQANNLPTDENRDLPAKQGYA